MLGKNSWWAPLGRALAKGWFLASWQQRLAYQWPPSLPSAYPYPPYNTIYGRIYQWPPIRSLPCMSLKENLRTTRHFLQFMILMFFCISLHFPFHGVKFQRTASVVWTFWFERELRRPCLVLDWERSADSSITLAKKYFSSSLSSIDCKLPAEHCLLALLHSCITGTLLQLFA